MKKSECRSFASSFCSLLTVLTATTVSNGAENVGESGHSLVLSDRFTEYVLYFDILHHHSSIRDFYVRTVIICKLHVKEILLPEITFHEFKFVFNLNSF